MLKSTVPKPNVPKEGDLYKELSIQEITFRVMYGYYEEYERNSVFNEPIPIYPDFIKEPVYTRDGIPFVTAMQDTCRHFKGKPEADNDNCMDCFHFHKQEDLIGLCRHPHNQHLKETVELPEGGE